MFHQHLKEVGSITNTVTLPHSGVVGVTLPDGVSLTAYLNDRPVALHHLHVNAGDCLHFKLEGNKLSIPSSVIVDYAGESHRLDVHPLHHSHKEHSSTHHSEAHMSHMLPHDSQYNIKESKMTTLSEQGNIFGMPGMGGFGGGAGVGAAVGGFLGSALGRNGNGLFGGNGNDAGISEVNNLQASIDTNAILAGIADVKAAVPLAEAQVQLALAGAQNDINSQIQSQTLNLTNLINQDILSTQKGLSDVNTSVLTAASINLAATKDAANANQFAINASTKEILAAINGNEISNLQRQLAVSESRNVEDRAMARSREVEVNVSQSVTQNQANLMNQQQAQSQAQQQLVLLSQIASGLGNLTQIAHATNSNIIAGNTGAVTTAAQTASPVNVRS